MAIDDIQRLAIECNGEAGITEAVAVSTRRKKSKKVSTESEEGFDPNLTMIVGKCTVTTAITKQKIFL